MALPDFSDAALLPPSEACPMDAAVATAGSPFPDAILAGALLPEALGTAAADRAAMRYTKVAEQFVRGLKRAGLTRKPARGCRLRTSDYVGFPIEAFFFLSYSIFKRAESGSLDTVSLRDLADDLLRAAMSLTKGEGAMLLACGAESGIQLIARQELEGSKFGGVPASLVREVVETGLTLDTCHEKPNRESPRPARSKQEPLMIAPVEWDFPIPGRRRPAWERRIVGVLVVRGKKLSERAIDLVTMLAKTFATTWHHWHDRMEQRLEQSRLAETNRQLQQELQGSRQMLGDTPAMEGIRRDLARAASGNSCVLLLGENGVGKEVAARLVHQASGRSAGPFVALNCAAIPESLVESTLFGSRRGAFTGASEDRLGSFEASHNGTLFLDEIGDMPLPAQAKLLRVLDGHPFERVGDHVPIRVNIRVVAATNRDLQRAVEQGRFRQDLYYRLNVITIRLPALRERRADIPLLLRRFFEEFASERTSFTPPRLNDKAMALVQAQDWPGNVRQLRSFALRVVTFAPDKGEALEADEIRPYLDPSTLSLTTPAAGGADLPDFDLAKARFELEYAAQLFARYAEKQVVAEKMGMVRAALSRLVQRHFRAHPELATLPQLEAVRQAYPEWPGWV